VLPIRATAVSLLDHVADAPGTGAPLSVSSVRRTLSPVIESPASIDNQGGAAMSRPPGGGGGGAPLL
jgi:hypothetical protein